MGNHISFANCAWQNSSSLIEIENFTCLLCLFVKSLHKLRRLHRARKTTPWNLRAGINFWNLMECVACDDYPGTHSAFYQRCCTSGWEEIKSLLRRWNYLSHYEWFSHPAADFLGNFEYGHRWSRREKCWLLGSILFDIKKSQPLFYIDC